LFEGKKPTPVKVTEISEVELRRSASPAKK